MVYCFCCQYIVRISGHEKQDQKCEEIAIVRKNSFLFINFDGNCREDGEVDSGEMA